MYSSSYGRDKVANPQRKMYQSYMKSWCEKAQLASFGIQMKITKEH